MFSENANNYLFADGDLHAALEGHRARATKRVENIPRDQFLNASVDTLVEHIASDSIVMKLEIHEDRMTVDQQEGQVVVRSMFGRYGDSPMTVPGVHATVIVPFTGEATLWKLQPNTFSSMRPQGAIRARGDNAGNLLLHFEARVEELSRIRSELDQQMGLIRQYVGWQSSQVDSSNSQLEPEVRRAVVARKSRLQEQSKLSDMLGIPLKHNPEAPRVAALPIKRKLVRPLPAAPRTGFVPEPGIADEEYEHILSVVRHGGRTFEAAPGTFSKLEEEELRDVLLANLNGHYAGDATGETFRKSGKTDIRIEDQNRAAFVAECKVWGGEKKMHDAIDQLLGYLTWRDCKASLVMFNKTVAGFAGLVGKLEGNLRDHPLFRTTLGSEHPGEWRHRFQAGSDPSREVIVHTFIFDIRHGA